jgi:glucose-6-phosphate isomerase
MLSSSQAMPSIGLRYDYANMLSAAVGKRGTTPAQWRALLPRLRTAKKAVQVMTRKREQGFLDLPFDHKALAHCKIIAHQLFRSCTDLVVLGIGGSDLGARMLLAALQDTPARSSKRLRVHFAGSSTDPTQLARLIPSLNWKKTAINIVSKSGDTVEPMVAFQVLRELLTNTVGQKRARERIVATTDAENGSLNALAKRENYRVLTIPRNVGGRFSVLSSVGLFPAVCAGVDADGLLDGARGIVETFHRATAEENPMMQFAGLQAVAYEQRDQRIQVIMPYSVALQPFGQWVRQLVAESLGKAKSRTKKTIYAGFTPVAAVGPEDQHSQLQLYAEGPFDKTITCIEIKRFAVDAKIPTWRSFSNLLHREREATAEALRRVQRANGTLYIPRLDGKSVGELILFYEISVALLGELLNVNAYNQPGVEEMKKILRGKKK